MENIKKYLRVIGSQLGSKRSVYLGRRASWIPVPNQGKELENSIQVKLRRSKRQVTTGGGKLRQDDEGKRQLWS